MKHSFITTLVYFCVLFVVIVQVSHPYKSTDSTVVINSRCLISRESVYFHISFSWLSARHAVAFLVLMSLSVVQTQEPRGLSSSTFSKTSIFSGNDVGVT